MNDTATMTQPWVRIDCLEAPDLTDDVEALTDAIFGPAERVVAILDANRILGLPDILEAEGHEKTCLFRGDLAKDAGDVSPWLVVVNRGDRLLKYLLTRDDRQEVVPFALWTQEAGVFLRTDMGLEALQGHLRRFLRVSDGNGKNFLFRYWEPSIAAAYYANINDRPELIERWFRAREGGLIDAIVAPDAAQDGPSLTVITPQEIAPSSRPPVGAFALNASDVALFSQVRMERDVETLTTRLSDTFPEVAKDLSHDDLRKLVQRMISKMMSFGFSQKPMLFTLLAWELHYGPDFERVDTEGELSRIMVEPRSAVERFELLKVRMEKFD